MSDKHQQRSQKTQRNLNDYARYSSLAFQMGLIIAAGTFGGIKLDSWLQFRFPVFTIILSLTAVGIALYIVIKDLSKTKDD